MPLYISQSRPYERGDVVVVIIPDMYDEDWDDVTLYPYCRVCIGQVEGRENGQDLYGLEEDYDDPFMIYSLNEWMVFHVHPGSYGGELAEYHPGGDPYSNYVTEEDVLGRVPESFKSRDRDAMHSYLREIIKTHRDLIAELTVWLLEAGRESQAYANELVKDYE